MGTLNGANLVPGGSIELIDNGGDWTLQPAAPDLLSVAAVAAGATHIWDLANLADTGTEADAPLTINPAQTGMSLVAPKVQGAAGAIQSLGGGSGVNNNFYTPLTVDFARDASWYLELVLTSTAVGGGLRSFFGDREAFGSVRYPPLILRQASGDLTLVEFDGSTLLATILPDADYFNKTLYLGMFFDFPAAEMSVFYRTEDTGAFLQTVPAVVATGAAADIWCYFFGDGWVNCATGDYHFAAMYNGADPGAAHRAAQAAALGW